MDLVQLTGRYLNFEEREEIAIMRSQGAGVRQIARALIAAMAEATPGVTVRRGVSVVGVVSAPGPSGVVHVNGVRTADGRSCGRRQWTALGGERVVAGGGLVWAP